MYQSALMQILPYCGYICSVYVFNHHSSEEEGIKKIKDMMDRHKTR